MNSAVKNFIIEHSKKIGFDKVAFAKADHVTDAPFFKAWLEKNYHADMHWMENHFEKRIDPQKLFEGAKTIVCFASNYYNYDYKNDDVKIARYALGDDYHEVLKKRLKELLELIQKNFPEVKGRYFTDTAPILERYWAEKSGLGWIGKNDMLITRSHGSYVFLSELILTIELEADEKHDNFCGSCRNCLEACPTDALLEAYTLNSNECISYITIEKRNEFSKADEKKIENNIFGCDICQEVCPWNRFAKLTNDPHFQARSDLLKKPISFWEKLSEEDYRKLFKKSAVKRTKYSGLKRNISAVERQHK